MQTTGKGTANAWRWKAAAAAAVGATTILQPTSYTAANPGMNAASSSAPTGTANYVDERLLDAKLQAVEARTETKFAQLLGEMRLIGQRVSDLSGTFTTEIADVKKATATVKWNILATGIALGALILGLFAYGQQMLQLAAGLFQAGGH